MLEVLESRRLLAGGVDPLGVATGAGPDTNLWFTLNSNAIGMINPANPGGGITQYAIPTPKSGAGPIAAGPQAILYASDLDNGQIYKVDKTTGALLQTIPVSEPLDSLIFDSHNDLIYSAFSVGGVGQVRRVDPTVGISSDTLLATVGNRAVDLALVPGGNSVLVTSQTTGMIYEVSLTNPGQTPTTIGSGQYKGGIVYDTSGRLFAVANSTIVELDPNTFSVIASSAPLSGLDGLAFDPFSGDLFASSRTVNSVSGREGFYELSLQPGSFLHATLITSSAFPTTFDPDGLEPDGEGNLYLASEAARGDNKIYQYGITTGQLTALTSPLPGLDDLVPLTGSGGHSVPEYWFFEQSADKFGAIDPTTGHITELPPLTTANTQVAGITAGPGGTIWFTESNTDQIGVIDTGTDQINEFKLNPGADPYGIVEGPDGTIWFTEAGANQIGRINPTTDQIQEYSIDSSGNDQAESIAIGPDKNLWFTLAGTNKIGVMNPTTGAMIGEYSVPTANAGLSQIVSDPAAGNLWFTEEAASNVGTIDPTTKLINEYPVPTAGAAPLAMAVNTSGNIWFTESNGGQIAELSPNNPGVITEYGVTGPATQLVIAPGGEPPSSVVAGGLFSVSLIAEDQYGDPATGFNGSVTLALVNGGGALQGNVTANAEGGQITFTGLSIDSAGAYQIEATSRRLSSVTTTFIDVTAGAATQLVVTPGNPPSSVAAGTNFGFTVDAEDSYGNLDTTFNATMTIALVNEPVGMLHGSSTATATRGIATFSGLAITAVGTYTIQATSGSLAASTAGPITVTAGPVSGLMVSQQPPSTIVAGATFGLAVEVVDEYGNPVDSPVSTVTIALANNPGVTLNGARSEPAQDGVATFSGLSIVNAGTYTIQAATGAITGTSAAVDVVPAPATKMVITSAPLTLVAGGRGLVNVELKDLYGNLGATSTSDQAVSLATTSPAAAFYASSSGGSAITGLTIPAGQSSATFYYADIKAGTPTITASASTLGSVLVQQETVDPAAASRAAITSAPLTLAAGSRGPVTLELEDEYGNLGATSTADQAIGLGTTSSVGGFYAGAAGGNPMTGVAIPAGQSSATVYYSDTQAGTPTLTVSDTALSSSVNLVETVNPAAADHFVLTTSFARSDIAGTPGTVTVTAKDHYGNTAGSGPDEYLGSADLAGTDGQATGLPAAHVFTANDAGFYVFTGIVLTTAGDQTITATDSVTSTVAGKATVNVVPAAASQVAITSPALTLVAGTRGPVTVQLEDPYGNPAAASGAAQTIALATTGVAGVFYATQDGSATITGIVIPADQSSATVYYGDTQAGGPTVAASDSALKVSAKQSESVVPAAPDHFVVTTTFPTSDVAGTARRGHHHGLRPLQQSRRQRPEPV